MLYPTNYIYELYNLLGNVLYNTLYLSLTLAKPGGLEGT